MEKPSKACWSGISSKSTGAAKPESCIKVYEKTCLGVHPGRFFDGYFRSFRIISLAFGVSILAATRYGREGRDRNCFSTWA